MPSDKITSRQIIEAKLFPSASVGEVVYRPHLMPPASFDAGTASTYLIKAPAGYGKSTLMADIYCQLQKQSVNCAWLSLDTDDNEPARVLHYLTAAIHQVVPDLVQESLLQIEHGLSDAKSILEKLAAELGELQQRLVIYIDDLQCITDPAVLDIFDWLLSYTPRNCQFILGSREEPQLKIGKLRVRRKLVEANMTALVFNREQTAEFLHSRLSTALTEAQISLLYNRTEGWPAGLELAALALENTTDVASLVENFAGDQQAVIDYLGDVLLDSLSDDDRYFIFRAAQFRRFSSALCNAIDHRSDSPSVLEKLRSKNMFMVSLDHNGQWYRFHHLISQYLRNRCNTEAPALAADSLATGARWFYQHDFTEEAINCALQAQDWASAANWIETHATEVLSQNGYLQTFAGWMNQLPNSWLNQYPKIRSSYTFAIMFYSNQRDVQKQIQHLESFCQQIEQDPNALPTVISELHCSIEHLHLVNSALLDRGQECFERAHKWLGKWPDAAANMRGDVYTVLAFGHKSRGEIHAGLDVIKLSRATSSQGEFHYNILWCYVVECLLLLKAGDFLPAKTLAEEGLDLVHRNLGGQRSYAAMCHAILAYINYELGDIDVASLHVEASNDTPDDIGQADIIILKYLTEARILYRRGHSEKALACLQRGQEIGDASSFDRVTVSLLAEECVLLCRANRLNDAEALARRGKIPVDTVDPQDTTPLRLDKSLRMGSRLLVQNDPANALAMIEPAIQSCEQRGFKHRLVELLIIRAAAKKQIGKRTDAVADVSKALKIGAKEGYYQIYIDDLDQISDALDTVLLEPDLDSTTRALIQRIKSDANPTENAKRDSREAIVDALSKREIQILKRLDSELSNREIAEAIFISEGTLKWHLHNIYGKLGVRNRSGALRRGRELGHI